MHSGSIVTQMVLFWRPVPLHICSQHPFYLSPPALWFEKLWCSHSESKKHMFGCSIWEELDCLCHLPGLLVLGVVTNTEPRTRPVNGCHWRSLTTKAFPPGVHKWLSTVAQVLCVCHAATSFLLFLETWHWLWVRGGMALCLFTPCCVFLSFSSWREAREKGRLMVFTSWDKQTKSWFIESKYCLCGCGSIGLTALSSGQLSFRCTISWR